MAESLKAGLIGDPVLWRMVETRGRDSLQRDEAARYAIIDRSVQLKLRIVERDLFERGERRTLNLGHTIGHALEVESGFALPHGQAVVLGLRAVAAVSRRWGADPDLADRIDSVAAGLGFELRREFDVKVVKSALGSDKKPDRCSKQVTLLSSIGTTRCDVEVGPEVAPWPGDDTPEDVIAECDLELAALPNATNTNLLNVCSFPSGEPNSNPFDCVITPGAGYLVIRKTTTPSTTASFAFALAPAARDGGTAYSAPGDDGSGGPGSSALIAVSPGTYGVTM